MEKIRPLVRLGVWFRGHSAQVPGRRDLALSAEPWLGKQTIFEGSGLCAYKLIP